jgi:hypothetical protein
MINPYYLCFVLLISFTNKKMGHYAVYSGNSPL